jgi:UDP-hydrolysing UDP-N-acetyl-D-glucosamine 2-epimerase
MTSKIVVVTGTRADYGLLRWLLAELKLKANLVTEILATGTHFSEEFGNTWKAIEADGFTVDHRVEMLAASDSSLDVALSTAKALAGIAEVFASTKPDAVVVLGDRYEILAATQAAFLLGIPVAHIAGGEVTEGALDDSIRHAITKLASLHFVAADAYGARVRQLGEDARTIFNVGATGLDNFERLALMDSTELSDLLGLEIGARPLAVVTIHPETTSRQPIEEFLAPTLSAMSALDDWDFVVTLSNADAGGRSINDAMIAFSKAHPANVRVFASLGQRGYLSAISIADVVLGNSSSGILEAPTAGVTTVNIGTRQDGRLRAPSVIDVENTSEAILQALKVSLSPEQKSLARLRVSPFGEPGAASKISSILAETNFKALPTKQFFDLETSGK